MGNLDFTSEFVLQLVDRIINLIRVSWIPLFLLWFVNKYSDEVKSFLDRVNELDLFGSKVKAKEKQTEKPSEDEKPALKKAKEVKESPKKTDDPEKILFLKNYLFEVNYREIFGSQIDILLELEGNRSNWTSGSNLIKHYIKAGWNYNNYPFVSYMGFLRTRLLIEYQPHKSPEEDPLDYYKLSNLGKEFLEYLRRNNLSLSKDK